MNLTNILILILGICVAALSLMLVHLYLKIPKIRREVDELVVNHREKYAEISARVERCEKAVKELQDDFEAVKAAAQYAGDFKDGLQNIFSYDPYEMLRKHRESENN